MDPTVQPKWYCFLFFIVTWEAITIVTPRSCPDRGLDKLSISIVLCCVYLLSRNFLSGYYLGMAIILGWLILYFLCLSIHRTQSLVFSAIVILLSLSQALYGLTQFVENSILSVKTPIVGSFDQPAGFAICLCIGIPFCLDLLVKKNYHKIPLTCVILILVVALLVSESRAGLISALVIFAIYLYKELIKRRKIKKLRLVVSSLFLSFVIFAGLFFIKKDSALGRILIWKNTIKMILDKPYIGSGQGSFNAKYMIYQAEFFNSHPTSSYASYADNIRHPYNEYLMVLTEYGILGLILGSVIAFILFHFNRRPDAELLSIVLILIFASFSYPFRYPCIWVVIAFCLASHSNRLAVIIRLQNISNLLYGIGKSTLLVLIVLLTIKDISFEYQWKSVSDLTESNTTQNILENYRELYKSWNGNPLFLYNYGAELYYLRKYPESLNILSKCEHLFNDYDVQILISVNCYNLNRWSEVENHLKLASKMCPARFRPLFYLFSYYKDTGKKEEARKLALLIKSKKVKIESSEIDFIKKEAGLYIKQTH